MESLSLIYEDVFISTWADEIRHIKIREMEELIIEKETAIKNTEIKNTDFETEDYMSLRRVMNLCNIIRLKKKLKILKP
jgi:hypothetical protein